MLAHVVHWINNNAAGIQAISAVVVAVLTAFLVFFTSRYVYRTGQALRLSARQLGEQRASLELLREQVEQEKQALELARNASDRDWRPQLRVLVHRPGSSNVSLEMVNLGRTAIHVESIEFVTDIGGSLRPDSMEWFKLIPVNGAESLNIYPQVFGFINKHIDINTGRPYSGNMAIRATFFSAGTMYDSEWFNFGIEIRNSYVTKISRVTSETSR